MSALSENGRRAPGLRSRRGAVMAEFAIVLPVFILAIIGIIEFGRAVMVQQILVNAAREGARRAIITGATNDEVTELVDNYLTNASLGAPGREIGILDSDDSALDLEDANSHDLIKVVVTVPYDEVGVGIGSWFSGSTMGAVCQMRKE
jgi:Flp pilus assembly protein TadG